MKQVITGGSCFGSPIKVTCERLTKVIYQQQSKIISLQIPTLSVAFTTGIMISASTLMSQKMTEQVELGSGTRNGERNMESLRRVDLGFLVIYGNPSNFHQIPWDFHEKYWNSIVYKNSMAMHCSDVVNQNQSEENFARNTPISGLVYDHRSKGVFDSVGMGTGWTRHQDETCLIENLVVRPGGGGGD